MTDKDIISMSDGHSFLTDPLLSIIKILSTTYVNGKYRRLPNEPDQLEKIFMINRWH